TQDTAYKIQLDVLFYASSNAVCCYKNPLVLEALKQINITPPAMDFYRDMKDFIKMRLSYND
ncbi:MAG: TetR/AcrR family transcriptional regulator, partial [Treponema sp.]|nr:TetR/AcrR family transcriptional regulator [Treponema sp.]